MSDKDQHESGADVSLNKLEKELLKKDPELLEKLTREQRAELLSHLKQIIRIEVTQSSSNSFSGPFPPPDVLEQYIRLAPDFAELIKKMSLDEQKYAHDRDSRIIDESFKLKKRGQTFALSIALFALTGGVICILIGFEVAGTIVSGVGLSGLVSEFLDRRKQTQDS